MVLHLLRPILKLSLGNRNCTAPSNLQYMHVVLHRASERLYSPFCPILVVIHDGHSCSELLHQPIRIAARYGSFSRMFNARDELPSPVSAPNLQFVMKLKLPVNRQRFVFSDCSGTYIRF